MPSGDAAPPARVAVVTGAASGIGAATAARLAAEGTTVVVADRDAAGAEACAAKLPAAVAVRCDVTVDDDVTELIGHAVERCGRLDVLVNAAGVSGTFASLAELPVAAFDATLAVNLRGTFLCL